MPSTTIKPIRGCLNVTLEFGKQKHGSAISMLPRFQILDKNIQISSLVMLGYYYLG